MTVFELIDKKRNKLELSEAEINFFVQNYVGGNILDEQASALLMAICINGMTRAETLFLTKAMAGSGEQLDLSELYQNGVNNTVDKHSSGGVSDTTTLIIAGLVASCEVTMLKMSGRSLGFTGGTAEKIECFSGYIAEQTTEQAIKIAKEHFVSLITQTKDLAPADKKLYALRDRTGTVESIPLIASSIMSKKLASGSGILLLDVKCGNGAFMKTKQQAKTLAKTMVRIGNDAGIITAAYVTDMSQPLGCAVGNVLEAREATEILKQNKKGRLTTLCLQQSAYLVSKAKAMHFDKAMEQLKQNLASGKAYAAFEQIIYAHGGAMPSFELASVIQKLYAPCSGVVSGFETSKIGQISNDITATIPNGGIEFFAEIGTKVQKGDLLAKVYANTLTDADKFAQQLASTICISGRAKPKKLIECVCVN